MLVFKREKHHEEKHEKRCEKILGQGFPADISEK
jgi:hypothetical protein